MENIQNIQSKNIMIVVSEHEWKNLIDTVKAIALKQNESNTNVVREFLSVKEFTDKYQMSRSQYEKLRRDGTIKTYKVRNKVYVKTSEVNTLFENSLM